MIKRTMAGFSGLVTCKVCQGTGVINWFNFVDATTYVDECRHCDGMGEKVIK